MKVKRWKSSVRSIAILMIGLLIANVVVMDMPFAASSDDSNIQKISSQLSGEVNQGEVAEEITTDATSNAENVTVAGIEDTDGTQVEDESAKFNAKVDEGLKEASASEPVATEKQKETRATGDIPIDEAHFPSASFREELSKTNYGIDRVFTEEELQKITELDFKGKPLGDVTGIEYFTQLTTLNVTNTSIQTLDVSNNLLLTKLHCDSNKLTNLDVSNNQQLVELSCSNNSVGNLNLTNNKKLERLQAMNCRMTELDVSANTNLNLVEVSSNSLTQINVSNLTNLKTLQIADNKLTELDVSKNLLLMRLQCGTNQLKQIDVSKNTELVVFECYQNQQTKIDISNNLKLSTFRCYYNKLTSLLLPQQVNDNAWSLLMKPQITGTIYTAEKEGKWQVNLSQIKSILGDEHFDASRVVMTDGGTLDNTTGIVTYTSKPTKIVYKYMVSPQGSAKEIYMEKVEVEVQVEEYTITYNLDGGNVTGNPETYTSEELPLTLKNPTKEGYKFLGWTGSNVLVAQKDYAIPAGTVGNLTFTANWEKIVDPPIDPVDPPIDPVDPPIDPVDPPIDPVDPGPPSVTITPVTPGSGNMPDTGDNSAMTLSVVLLLAAGTGVIVLKRRKG